MKPKSKPGVRKITMEEYKLQTWIRAAGRCQFPGCGKDLLQEALTQKSGFYGQVAHIVGKKAGAARGDEIRSPLLATNTENTMLLCYGQHRLADYDHPDDFPEEALLQYKKISEERIDTLLSIPESRKRTVLKFTANIQNQQIADTSLQAIHDSLLGEGPYYPDPKRRGIIELTYEDPPRTEVEWMQIREKLAAKLNFQLQTYLDNVRDERFALFAIGPIPLLIELGRLLPNTLVVDVYQRCRSEQKWMLGEKLDTNHTYLSSHPTHFDEKSKDIVLKLSISGQILQSEVTKAIQFDWPVYSIELVDGRPGLALSEKGINDFIEEFQKILVVIRSRHGSDATIHLFPAIPNAVAIHCGLSILHKTSPSIHIYDNDKDLGGFVPTFKI